MRAIHIGVFVVGVFCVPLFGGERPKPNLIVIFTDDHGWSDLGAQGVREDVRTPQLDALAAGGVRATNGYVTAPQCVPSRGGLLVGKFQGRFQLDSNGSALDGFLKETTIATRLRDVGYATGMSGKWHLGPPDQIARHGFTAVYCNQGAGGKAWANFDLEGNTIPGGVVSSPLYHLEANAAAACAFIQRHHAQPFFFYLAFRAPHTPLDAPPKYTSRIPGPMPERRRQALAMISAVDDGVGRIMRTLREHELEERTLLFFMGDNGAPLKIHKVDSPLDGDAGGWDGSLNDPLNGEKGMLSEGGIRVPWLAYWKGTIPGGLVYEHPVISLDVAATAAAVAGIETAPGDLDGVNLLPHFTGELNTPPHDALMWRWTAQSAIRAGRWKLLRGGQREYLYDLAVDPGEKNDVAAQHRDVADGLRAMLTAWCSELDPPGLALGPMATTWNDYFDYYLEGKPVSDRGEKVKGGPAASEYQGWVARNGTLAVKDGALQLTSAQRGTGKAAFLACSQLQAAGPVTAELSLRTSSSGQAAIAWRTSKQKDFVPENQIVFQVSASDDWRTHEIKLPVSGTLIHVRLHLPAGTSLLRQFELRPAEGRHVSLWKQPAP
ncbi:MAG: aryl-sulfate sulfohydrolase [Planctomycetes bacterium]|nr:aryl-sulfate sulfohydrolase [Planctomycetota bacterium]